MLSMGILIPFSCLKIADHFYYYLNRKTFQKLQKLFHFLGNNLIKTFKHILKNWNENLHTNCRSFSRVGANQEST